MDTLTYIEDSAPGLLMGLDGLVAKKTAFELAEKVLVRRLDPFKKLVLASGTHDLFIFITSANGVELLKAERFWSTFRWWLVEALSDEDRALFAYLLLEHSDGKGAEELEQAALFVKLAAHLEETASNERVAS